MHDYAVVESDPTYAMLVANGYITTGFVKPFVSYVLLTPLGDNATDGPEYAHQENLDCDEWQVSLNLAKYDHLEITSILENGVHANVGSSEEFVGYLVHLGRASVHSNTLPDRASRRGQIGE